MKTKKNLILAITLLLLFTLCIDALAAKKVYESFGGFPKKSPKIVGGGGDEGTVVIQRYRGSW